MKFVKHKECRDCGICLPYFRIEMGACPKCCGFTDEELADDIELMEAYVEHAEKNK